MVQWALVTDQFTAFQKTIFADVQHVYIFGTETERASCDVKRGLVLLWLQGDKPLVFIATILDPPVDHISVLSVSVVFLLLLGVASSSSVLQEPSWSRHFKVDKTRILEHLFDLACNSWQ